MTPEEALEAAIETKSLESIQEILNRLPCDYTDAMAQAAGLNRLDIVNLLIKDIFKGSGESASVIYELGCEVMLESMHEGALSAARNGHVAIVGRLLPLVIELARSISYLVYWLNRVQEIMDEGAVNGQLEVVKFMVEDAAVNHYGKRYSRWNPDDTLTKAIVAGHTDVVNQRCISWNMKSAFIAALDKGQEPLAERIRERYPKCMQGQDLFMNVAHSGDLNAVKYLYTHGCNDPDLVGRAFTTAASEAQNKGVEFLAGTGCVSSKAFEKAFKTACSGYNLNPECFDTVTFLYKLNKVSLQCIECVFGLASSFAILKFLYENEKISDKAILTAFGRAVHSFRKEHSEIILFLYKQPCIPSELIDKAFVRVVKSLNGARSENEATSTKTQVVKCLRDDERLSPKAMDEAFMNAAKRWKSGMTVMLYDEQRTPPEFLVKAFVEAMHRNNTAVTKDVLKLLAVEEYVPQKFMHETFVAAARHGQMPILKLVCENLPSDLPLEVLKNALDVAGGNHKIESLIRKIACNQVFKETQ